MGNKTIDAACIGYDEEMVPCERELQELGYYSACTVVAHNVTVDEDGDLKGVMLLSFGDSYGKDRMVSEADAKDLVAVINDVIERRACDLEGDGEDGGDECDGDCASCVGAEMDVTAGDVAKLGEELKQAIEDFEKLLEVVSKK